MNYPLPLELRIRAAMLHAIGSIPMASVLAYVILESIPGGREAITGSINRHFFPSVGVVIIIPTVAVLILWQAIRKNHLFIDNSGRDAINSTLSSVIMSFMCLLVSMLLDWMRIGANDLSSIGFLIASIIFVSGVYFLNFVIAGIFTLRGYRFKSILIFPFIKDIL